MICKNCKMSTLDTAKSCEVCGKTIQGNSAKWKGLVAALSLAAGVSIFVFGGYGEGFTDEILEIYAEAETVNYEGSEVRYRDIITSAPLLAPPEVQADLDMAILDVWRKLDEVSGFINEHYDYYSETVLFLSKNGYLFDFPAWSYVFIEELADLTDIDEEYLVEGIMFFYMRPMDLARFRNVNVSERDSLTIFTGFEVREGFAITGRGEQGGTISREDLQTILGEYSWDHGEIRKIYSQTDTFESVMRALADYTGNQNGFDIRYLYRDDRFICIVASPVGEPLNINMFVLEYLESAVFVRVSHLETFNAHRRALNNALPNFNQNLLPDYDLRHESRYLVDDFDEIIYDMLYAGLIAENDLPLRFASGTWEYVYFEFDSGAKFVGRFADDIWVMYLVDNYMMARAVLYSLSRRPPLFIVRQD